MSFSRWQNESDRMIAKVVLSTEEGADVAAVGLSGAAPAARVLSVISPY